MDFLKYKNYIFDFDGTLVDSMPYWISRPSEFIKFKGLNPREDLDQRVAFFESYEAAEVLKKEYNLSGSVNEVFEEMKKWIYEEYRYVDLKEKAFDLICYLHSLGKKLFILSASVNELILPSVSHKDIKKYFVDVISASSKNLSKEEGNAFDFIIDKYNLNKEETLVLDDSPMVIKKCKEKGIDSLAIKEDFYNEHKAELIENSLGYYSLKEIYDKRPE
jgi:FMN phosphatase YigB (HAD superfamily)